MAVACEVMRVGFYLENHSIRGIDLTRPELGNPGCGGTEYLFVALPYYLQKMRSESVEPVILANSTAKLPSAIESIEAESLSDAAQKAFDAGCLYFVYRPRREADYEFLHLIEHLGLASIAWAHITPTEEHLRRIRDCVAVKAVVCVEHEQHDQAYDSSAWRKLTYIVNGFDVDSFRDFEPPPKKPNSVVYIGALVPQKGFHELADAWLQVVEKHPEAHLTVAGSGGLYGEGGELGPLGIADRKYEERFTPSLLTNHGEIHDSVTFMGRVGLEKKQILSEALIGVPNPTGQTENCPGSALEFQAAGTAVVSGGYYGMLDTIEHKVTGLLGRGVDELVTHISYFLSNPEEAKVYGERGIEFVSRRYNFDCVTAEWCELFQRLESGARPAPKKMKRNYGTHYKYAIAANRVIQKMLSGCIKWPSIAEAKLRLVNRLRSN
ncbi:MAG: glycosyltransferase family 4 protein [Verrucomicrobiota bacterium]